MCFLRLLIIPLTLPLINSCLNDSNTIQTESSELRSEVRQRLNDYVLEVNENGLKDIHIFFSDEDGFYWVEDGVIQYSNKKSLKMGLEKFIPSVSDVKMEIFDTKIDMINEKHAVVFVQYIETIDMKSGYKLTLDGAMTIIMKKYETDWKFLNGHSSIKKPRGDQQ